MDAQAAVGVQFEAVDLADFGVAPGESPVTELVAWCALTLGANAIEPEAVRLVIAGDFTASVNARMGDLGPVFDTRRNGGTVGGKTMALEDGTIDVVLPAAFFSIDMEPLYRARVDQLTKRTVTHESFHVAMMQAGEGEQSYATAPLARQQFLACADFVIGEYRAEAAVPSELRGDEPGWDLADVLETLRRDLTQITTMDYQQHRDVGRLTDAVMSEVLTAWKILAVDIAVNETLEPDDANGLWDTMVGPHGDALTEILHGLPPGSERVNADDLERATARLADEFDDWLHRLGFHLVDYPDGHAQFNIVSWDLFVQS
ncbi:hypothetical protein [Cellulosimicrobium funkei]|uniref:Uncharacterized protein n=1 Tax=Cellulosimicrobium funkei TaxID=264251 RepID=A0A4Y8R2S9_9MICO|nr:hypothetical protein [Cellulosimicrobium funkei]TFF12435.1 hypothetical protein E1O70_05960 [Cellulosimicrobium funkei]TGA77446.1 hypothetical protein EQW79_005535 [Cellulosimicrobium terreum]